MYTAGVNGDEGEGGDKMKLVTIPCGCQYDTDGTIVIPCKLDRYITCARCGDKAEVSPIGVLCLRCTFGRPRATA